MEKLPKKYISVDIESNGPYPWNSSLLSLGACIVGDPRNNFYAELKPIREEYSFEHFKIGGSSLDCLASWRGEFNPKKALELLEKKGEDPKIAMPRFANWVIEQTKGHRPILTASPIVFDGPFVNYYLDKFYEGENPFGHSGEDINSMFRGKVGNKNGSIKDLALRGERGLGHHALADAIQQAREFFTILVYMGQEKD